MPRTKSLALFALLVVGLVVAACAGSPSAPAASTAPTTAPAAQGGAAAAPTTASGAQAAAPAAAGAVDLDFYYPVAVPGPITQILDKYAADFHKDNPNINVKPVLAGSYQDALTKIQTTVQGGGAPPGLAVLLSTDMWSLIDADAIVPLDQCISTIGGDAYLKDFFPAFMANSQVQGKTWGIPFQRSTPVLYYNKDAFKEAGLDPEKPPKNWDELVSMSQKLTKKDANGQVTRWGVQIPSDGFPYWMFQGFAIEAGKNIVGDSATEVYFNTPEVKRALEFWASLSSKYNVMQPGVIAWATTPNDFTAGKTAMMYHTTGSLTNVLKQAQFPVGVAFMPADKGYGAPTGGGNLYIFKNAPKEKQDAACKFIQFLTSPERAAQWSIDTGYVATRNSAYDTQAMKDLAAKQPQYLVAKDQLQYAQRELGTHAAPQLQQTLGNNIQAVIAGKKTADQAMQDGQAEADRILKQFK